MPTQQEIEQAIQRAQASGDTRAVEVLSSLRQSPQSSPITGPDVLRGGLSGATLGFGDELRAAAFAGLSALPERLGGQGEPFGANYLAYRDAERAELDRFRQEHPVAATASELAGGLAAGIVGGGALGATKAAQGLRQAGLGARMLGAAGAGGATGALAGAGEAEELSDVPMAAAKGGGIGAALGPAVELVGTGAQLAGRGLRSGDAADRGLRRAIRRGGMSIPQIKRQIDKLGPGAVLADVNEGLLSELDRLVNTPGKIRTQAGRQLYRRATKQIDEILNATGGGQYFEMLEATKAMRKNAASPLYRRAFDKGVDHNDALEEIFEGLQNADRGFWRKAKQQGMLHALGEGEPIDPALLGDARPSLMGWQAIKESLDDKISALYRQAKNKQASDLRAIKDRLLAELDAQNSDYGIARGMWAGTKQFDDMMKEGFDFTKPGMSASRLRHRYSALSDVDRQAYREGVRQAIQDLLEKAGETHDLSKFFRTPAMQKKIRTVFDRGDAAKILRTVEAVSKKNRTFNRTRGNSLTAMRQAQQAEERLGPEVASALAEFMFTGPAGASAGVARRLASKAAVVLPGQREAAREALGGMLLETDPEEIARILERTRAPRRLTGPGLIAPMATGAAGGLLAAP